MNSIVYPIFIILFLAFSCSKNTNEKPTIDTENLWLIECKSGYIDIFAKSSAYIGTDGQVRFDEMNETIEKGGQIILDPLKYGKIEITCNNCFMIINYYSELNESVELVRENGINVIRLHR